MAELVVYAGLNDVSFMHHGTAEESYASVHDEPSCSNPPNINAKYYAVWQSRAWGIPEPWYIIGRFAIPFDVSLPVGFVVQSAILSLKMNDGASGATTDFDVVIVDGSSLVLGSVAQAADYGRLLGSVTSFGSKNTSEMPPVGDAWYDFELNANGIAAITSGIVKLGLRNSRDINSQPPTIGDEGGWWSFYSKNKGPAYAPKLTITYEIAVAVNKAYALAREEL
ncbi:hypothetical protein ES707_03847 [subsurface metagenome]